MHRSFADFYADNYGVRTRYLAMLGEVAGAFAAIPGVIGYDPLNEPWGDERREIMPLYRDAARALRARHPTAILFLEAHGPTAAGIRTRLPYPGLDNIAFAPHYYKPLTIALEDWGGQTATINRAFDRMEAKAAEWGVPLILGEIGIQGCAGRAGDYVDYLYDRLDAEAASALQWNVAPHWTPQFGDGWNGEDFSVLDGVGRPRPNYRPRPFPRAWPACPSAFDSRRRRRRGGALAWNSSGSTDPASDRRRSSCRPGSSRSGRAEGRARRRRLPLGPLAPAPDLQRLAARNDPRCPRGALNRRSSTKSPLLDLRGGNRRLLAQHHRTGARLGGRSAPIGPKQESPGRRPGTRSLTPIRALKERYTGSRAPLVPSLQGSSREGSSVPGASPRAGLFGPSDVRSTERHVHDEDQVRSTRLRPDRGRGRHGRAAGGPPRRGRGCAAPYASGSTAPVAPRADGPEDDAAADTQEVARLELDLLDAEARLLATRSTRCSN